MGFATPANQWFNKSFWASVFFENSNTKAQVTGNFDGAGLTCGFLGWTFLFGDQQKLVKQFVSTYPGELEKIMPVTGKDYWSACQMSDSNGADYVGRWSHGATVLNPNRNELQAFWNSPDMISIQLDKANADMGPFAESWTQAFCQRMSCPATLNIYAMFFDVKTQNGSMKDLNCSLIPLDRGQLMSNCTGYIKWAAEQNSGAMHDDMNKNAALWGTMLQSSDDWRLGLFQLAFLRSMECRDQYRAACLCRKGTLIFGNGWVNGERYTL